MTGSIHGNIWKLLAVEVTNDAIFFMPIIFLLFQSHGLSVGDLFWLQSAFTLAVMVLEIPSGYLSDRLGRKRTLLLGSICGLAGILAYATHPSYWGFFTGEMLLAIQVSCFSGTMAAMLYDTLLEIHEEEALKNRRLYGRQQRFGLISQAITSLLGGIIATVSIQSTVWLTVIPFVLCVIFVALLQEPQRHRLQETRHLKAIWDITAHSLTQNVPLRSIVILFAVISTLTRSLMWFTQPYLIAIGLPLVLFGVIHTVIMFATGYSSGIIHRLEKRVDDRLLLIVVATVTVTSCVALGLTTSWGGLVFLFTGRVMWGFISPLTSDLINRMTTSDIRATVLSIPSMIDSLLFTFVGTGIGYLTGVVSLNQAIVITGTTTGVVLAILFFQMRHIWKQLPQ